MKGTADYGRLLGLREVSERLGISLHTIRRWASQRRLPVTKISNRVLIAERELERFVQDRSQEARSDIAI